MIFIKDHEDPVYQSTAVLHKYLNDELKILSLLQFFRGCTEFPENSMSFRCSQKSLSIELLQIGVVM